MANDRPLYISAGITSVIPVTDFIDPGAGIQHPNGSAAAPSCAFNTTYGFFYDTTNVGIGVTLAGSQIGWVAAAGATFSKAGAGYLFTVQSEGGNAVVSNRFSADNASPTLQFGKARGTIASPAVPVTNDGIGAQFSTMWTGAAFNTACRLRTVCIETSPVDPTHLGASFRFDVCAIGSASLTEVFRIEAGTGLSMFGANPVIDQNRTVIPASSTVAALPAIVTSGLRNVSNLEGGQGTVFGGNSFWRNMQNGQVAQATISGSGVLSKMTGYFNTSQRALVSGVMQKLLDTGLLAKLGGLWAHAVPTNSTDGLLNWITPGTGNLISVGSPTWTANKGFTGDGSTAQLVIGSLAALGAANSNVSIGTYILTASAAAKAVIGMGNVAQARIYYLQSFTSGALNVRWESGVTDTYTPSQYTGMFVLSRGLSTNYQASVNDGAQTTITRNVSGNVTNSAALLATTDTTSSEFSTAQIAFSFVGTALTATDIANLRWIMVDYYLVGIGAIPADYTVATLPLATTPPKGSKVFVTDALAPVFASTLTGGGAVYTPVYTDNTNWRAG